MENQSRKEFTFAYVQHTALSTFKLVSCKHFVIDFTNSLCGSLDLASLLQKPVGGGREPPSSSSSQSLVFTNSHHHQPPQQQQQPPPSRNATSSTSYAHAALVKLLILCTLSRTH